VRYLKITLLIGFAVALVVAGLYEVSAFSMLDLSLCSFMGRASRPSSHRLATEYILFVFLALGIAWTTVDINRPSFKIVVAAGALVEVLALPLVLNLYHIFFSPFPPALSVCLSFSAAFAYSRSEAGRRKRTLRGVLGVRLSNKAFAALVDSDVPLHFEGQLRETSIVVCEIFNHDTLVEGMPAADYVAMTNQFLEIGSEFLLDRGAYLDECDGESLRVIFGSLIEDSQHAIKACEAAVVLAQRLENLNLECESMWHNKFDFRIGINSGEVVAAAYGSKRLGSFSIAGESVEFTRRLCSANMIYGTRILIGPETYALAADAIEIRPVELIRGKVPNSRSEIYELLAMKNVLSVEELQKRDMFWKGIVYYREQKWDDAMEHFKAALSMTGTDAPVEFYIRRIEHLRTGTPPLDWDNARI
jgi:adenylate cyclase